MEHNQSIIEKIIKTAAEEAQITEEQSLMNLKSAFKSIQVLTHEMGEIDLSEIGVTVSSRTIS